MFGALLDPLTRAERIVLDVAEELAADSECRAYRKRFGFPELDAWHSAGLGYRAGKIQG